MIQINNMIPVADGQAVLLDIQAESVKYQNLLGHQLAFIKSNQDAIKSRADKLYKLVVVDKHPHWSKLSCRFLELEAACTAFELAQAQPQPAATGQENAV
ncbi:hypothetical protein A7X83_03370 [Stenotrophomonas maltophilia]|uniref:Uncharacterized protein n=2 Tax=Stenotrophomonas maltophilia TaxID=40324 RepID=A0A2W6IMT4_STEMA|nr:hypothetical protein A7X83_03370 [Stenotrophomonas maltophilia]